MYIFPYTIPCKPGKGAGSLLPPNIVYLYMNENTKPTRSMELLRLNLIRGKMFTDFAATWSDFPKLCCFSRCIASKGDLPLSPNYSKYSGHAELLTVYIQFMVTSLIPFARHHNTQKLGRSGFFLGICVIFLFFIHSS